MPLLSFPRLGQLRCCGNRGALPSPEGVTGTQVGGKYIEDYGRGRQCQVIDDLLHQVEVRTISVGIVEAIEEQ